MDRLYSSRRAVARACAGILAVLALAVPLTAADDAPAVQAGEHWCGTQWIYEQKNPAVNRTATSALSCDPYHDNGPCDNPETRDTYIPNPEDPIIYVRLVIHVLAMDDGTYVFSTPAEVQAMVDKLNADFAQANIQFIHQYNIVRSTEWRTSLEEAEINAMKVASAIEPDRYLNVWVTQVAFSYSFGTFPWSYDALNATGGIVMGHFHWVIGPNSVFSHEVGHCIGLYHTFHGVSEVDQCGDCYEPPQSASSWLGDLCADTPPTPEDSGPCADPGGTDICTGLPWGETMPENYMSYNSYTCQTTFTPEQRGRMRCWLNGAIDSWTLPFVVDAQPVFGPVPLEVTFGASTHKTPLSWYWQFGDGDNSADQNPVHLFDQPGYYDVSLDLQTTSGGYLETFPGMVSVHADTIEFAEVQFDAFDTARVDINLHNFIPVKDILIPFTYNGPLSIIYRYVTAAGLRTQYFETIETSSTVPQWKVATIHLNSGSQPLLPPGNGPIATLVFYYGGAASGQNTVKDTTYLTRTLKFAAEGGEYVPTSIGGAVKVSCCVGTVGDANNDGGADPTNGDISTMIDFLFISSEPLACYAEADVNQTGGADPGPEDITIGDISALIDVLFITAGPAPDCL